MIFLPYLIGRSPRKYTSGGQNFRRKTRAQTGAFSDGALHDARKFRIVFRIETNIHNRLSHRHEKYADLPALLAERQQFFDMAASARGRRIWKQRVAVNNIINGFHLQKPTLATLQSDGEVKTAVADLFFPLNLLPVVEAGNPALAQPFTHKIVGPGGRQAHPAACVIDREQVPGCLARRIFCRTNERSHAWLQKLLHASSVGEMRLHDLSI